METTMPRSHSKDSPTMPKGKRYLVSLILTKENYERLYQQAEKEMMGVGPLVRKWMIDKLAGKWPMAPFAEAQDGDRKVTPIWFHEDEYKALSDRESDTGLKLGQQLRQCVLEKLAEAELAGKHRTIKLDKNPKPFPPPYRR